MKNWREDLLRATDGVQCEHAQFKKIVLNSYAVSWWTRCAR